MKHTPKNTMNREMHGCGARLCNEEYTGSDACAGKCSTGTCRQCATEQDVEYDRSPEIFRQQHPALQPERGEAG